MNAYSTFPPTDQVETADLPAGDYAGLGRASTCAMSMRWSALHDAVGAVAMAAGIAAEPMRPEVRDFPMIMKDAGGWRRNLAEQGIEDLCAIMEPGLAALLAVNARGADCTPAALTLWQEFQTARTGLLMLAPPQAGPAVPRLT